MEYTEVYYRPKRRLHRSRENKVFAGVCSGLAEHFDLNVTWVRVGAVLATLATFPVVPLFYVACVFFMPSVSRNARGRYASDPSVPQFSTQEEAIQHLHDQFDQIEAKVRSMEDHVTSKEYVLKRKFEDL